MPYYPNVPRCQHLKVNGTQCGSPALTRNRFCFFHKRFQDQRVTISATRRRARATFDLPVLEDANAIQVSLMQTVRHLVSGQIDPKIAGLVLYALQTASVNLRQTRFEPLHVKDVVIDRNTIDQTRIGSDQWCEEDFEEESSEEDLAEQESAKEAAAKQKAATAVQAKQATAAKAKAIPLPNHVAPDALVRGRALDRKLPASTAIAAAEAHEAAALDKASRENALRENEQEKTRRRAEAEADFNRRVLAHEAAATTPADSTIATTTKIRRPPATVKDKARVSLKVMREDLRRVAREYVMSTPAGQSALQDREAKTES
jgi:hypothetical protein